MAEAEEHVADDERSDESEEVHVVEYEHLKNDERQKSQCAHDYV